MKKMFVLFELLGFILMLGAAGSADNNTISFLQAFLMEIFGIAVILLSASAHCYYKKYCRNKRRRKALKHSKVLLKKTALANGIVNV